MKKSIKKFAVGAFLSLAVSSFSTCFAEYNLPKDIHDLCQKMFGLDCPPGYKLSPDPNLGCELCDKLDALPSQKDRILAFLSIYLKIHQNNCNPEYFFNKYISDLEFCTFNFTPQKDCTSKKYESFSKGPTDVFSLKIFSSNTNDPEFLTLRYKFRMRRPIVFAPHLKTQKVCNSL